jgi:hypothetical protein
MALELWALLAEIIGTTAIVITLIYLAIQTKQNAKALLANTRDTQVTSDLILLQQVVDNPVIATSRFQEFHTDDDYAKVEAFLIQLIRSREHQWFQYKDGLLDKQAWDAYGTGLTYTFSYPNERALWNYFKVREFFDQEFMDEVDKLITSVPLQTDLRPTLKKAIEEANTPYQE